MENIELIDIWKAQNAKIEKSLAINELLLKEVTNSKVKSSLKSLITLKTAGIVSFILYILLLSYLFVYSLSNYSSALNYFIVSIFVIIVVNMKHLQIISSTLFGWTKLIMMVVSWNPTTIITTANIYYQSR
jgi:hypothetical protein